MTVQHGFKAEVQKLLELMIHSVYSDREVFLRELVSNAADALDKARFMALTRTDLVEAHAVPGIRITADAEAGTVTIEDDGVGMTEEEAVENLGTIAKSGTKAFLEAVKDQESAPNLIGQFGLGFYSAFMVADEVTVESRSALPDAPPVKWVSQGEGTFEISEGSRETRGTKITLHLREDAKDFAEIPRLKHIVRKHSNFLAWPIEVDGEQANSGKALWAEPPSQVSEDEANQFYKTVAMDWRDPALRIHLSVDSPFQYHALLFVPAERPYDLFNPEAPRGPRLYAKRVLIEEHARELLPDWLRFVRGVVDSEDISLNVSREMVQKTPIVQKIKKALTKRILKDLNTFAEAEVEAPESDDDEAKATYEDVWRQFGALLKEGYYHERQLWSDQLLPLFRFNTTAHDDETGLMSLAAYKEAMPEGQDAIWYLTAESRQAALSSPHLEAFKKRGWNVLLLTETVDEWFVSALTEFDGLPVKSVARGELDLEEEDDGAEKADLSGLTPWMAEVLSDAVSGVRASTRLTDSAVVLVDDDAGLSSNMERILRAANQDVYGGAKRILELNPRHPLIVNLAKLHETDRKDDAGQLAKLLLDDAMLLDGTVKDPTAMGRRLQDLLVKASEAALSR
ncbi:MAG: molecular chaperone HtpG [Alphaproteobacteria bacterium]|nr:molecular chaperone HtpG [Alphaproteobacteria bacterium]